jgi:hypothetical protein
VTAIFAVEQQCIKTAFLRCVMLGNISRDFVTGHLSSLSGLVMTTKMKNLMKMTLMMMMQMRKPQGCAQSSRKYLMSNSRM